MTTPSFGGLPKIYFFKFFKRQTSIVPKKRQPLWLTLFFSVVFALVGMIGLDLGLVELLLVDGTPGIDDVGQDEGHEQ